MRDAAVVKHLDAAMRTYATMIVQLQGVLLIKALAKDEMCRQQLVQIGIGQLLTSAASKHPTLTRLHKMVDDLKVCAFHPYTCYINPINQRRRLMDGEEADPEKQTMLLYFIEVVDD